jgi:hypothetical protein
LLKDTYRTNTPLSPDFLFNWFLHSPEKISFFRIFWLTACRRLIQNFSHPFPRPFS